MGVSNLISAHVIDFDLPGNHELNFNVYDVVGKEDCTMLGFYYDTLEANHVAGIRTDYEFTISKKDAIRLRDKLNKYLKEE